MINWEVRIKNKNFWNKLIPAVALLVQLVATLFGFTVELDTLVGKLIATVDAIFAILVILGIVNDPTTEGFVKDSKRALSYNEPWVDDPLKE